MLHHAIRRESPRGPVVWYGESAEYRRINHERRTF